jgi:hypothetical protein
MSRRMLPLVVTALAIVAIALAVLFFGGPLYDTLRSLHG